MNAIDIILRPIITEKSMKGIAGNRYTFKVSMNANKIEIAKAAEAVFDGVKVAKVNTMHVRGRKRTRGKDVGMTPSWKKAIITMTPDSKPIEFFEGMM